jgi:hypothetical protein
LIAAFSRLPGKACRYNKLRCSPCVAYRVCHFLPERGDNQSIRSIHHRLDLAEDAGTNPTACTACVLRVPRPRSDPRTPPSTTLPPPVQAGFFRTAEKHPPAQHRGSPKDRRELLYSNLVGANPAPHTLWFMGLAR